MSDEEGDCCQVCNGRGGNVESQDPVGDGGGLEYYLDACPNCIGADKCPGCMGPLVSEPSDPYVCQDGCGWLSESMYAPYDHEPSWGDYGDD